MGLMRYQWPLSDLINKIIYLSYVKNRFPMCWGTLTAPTFKLTQLIHAPFNYHF